MKKILFTLVCLSIFAFSAHSQLRLGVRGGFNLSGVSVSGADNVNQFVDKNVTGFQLGAMLEWMIKDRVGIETGLLYSERGMKFRGGDRAKDGYIDVPLNLKIKFPIGSLFKPFLNAGPYVSFRVSGDDNIKTISDNVDYQWKAQTFGAGLNFGGGVELFHFLQIGANYGFSMTDNFRDSNDTYNVKDRTWSATAAIFF